MLLFLLLIFLVMDDAERFGDESLRVIVTDHLSQLACSDLALTSERDLILRVVLTIDLVLHSS
jgi:hypothetical protein